MKRNELKRDFPELFLKVQEMEVEANKDRHSPETKKVWGELGKRTEACFALGQRGGNYTACLRPVVEGKNRCSLHGALGNENVSEESKLKKLQNLRPTAPMVHGLYAEKGNFIESLTEGELRFMAWLDQEVRSHYEVESGIGDVILEGLLHDAILHFRLLNSGRLERGSKHTAKPLMDLMKACKEMGWVKKSDAERRTHKTAQAVADLLAFADNYEDEEEDKQPLN
ncbi:hypothetical protein [Jeotgalibacillus malaysiensis]|uniref:hypothetical protein n=1 Tax=Jeotgalibacillus malaysiensis TaxID=1508404 RepID=UPI00384DDB28